MALATRCPHCQTTFRVAHDQLKLRAGLVRCGACKEIFNGVENLLPVETLQQSATLQGSSSTQAQEDSATQSREDVHAPAGQAAITPPHTVSPPNERVEESQTTNVRMTDDAAEPAPGHADTDADPLQRMTLMDFSAWESADDASAVQDKNIADQDLPLKNDPGTYSQTEPQQDTADELDRAIEDLQRKPWRRKKSKKSVDDDIEGDDDIAEPDFVKRARRQQQMGRTLRILMSIGSLILLITLLGQSAYTFRNQLAARLPELTPMLIEACARIGCDVGFPAQIDAVSIESNELQTLVTNQDTFVLNVLLRNRSATTQAWPSIELTLNDANEKAIARRVFSPREYLGSPNVLKNGFGANSEQSIKIFFELSELKASGYRVYLFYP